jgi:hypothetical protein
LAAKLAGYKHAGEVFGSDKSLAEQYKPGGYLGHSAASQQATSEAVDRYLVPPPVTPQGKFVRAATSAGIEALGGSGLFRVAATGQVFTNAADATNAARQAEAAIAAQKAQAGVPMPTTGVRPALDFQAPQAVRELGENIPLQGAYSAAAGGGAEIAEQQGAPPIVGALLGTVAAGGAHVAANAVPVTKAGVAGVKSTLDEMLSRSEDVQQRKAAEALREAAFNKPELKAWAQRAQDAEDAFADEQAKGTAADATRLQVLDTARREAHGELVRNSEPTLFEATEDKGVGKLERNMRQGNTADFGITNEIRREQQNAARLAEIEALGGEGRQAALLEEFRRQRAEEDAGHARTEANRQTEADEAAARAGTGETAEAIGERVRAPVVAQEAAVRQEGNRLYGLVAKEGVTVGTGRVKAAVGEHFRESLEKPLSPTEKYYADLVRGYGGQLDFQRMQDLRSAILSKLREDLTDIETSRYTKLQTAIDEAMDDGLLRAIKDDPTLFQRAAAGLDEQSRRQAEAWGVPPPPPQGRTPPSATATEPVDDAVTQAQRRANRYWKEKVKQPFEAQPVAPVIQKQRQSASGFKMTEAAIPEAVFRPGNTGGEKIRAMRAAGATDAALSEAAALSFQQRVVRDGGVSVETFRKWVRDHKPAIDELPLAVRQRFSSAASAAAALEEAATARQAAQRAFDESAVGEVLAIAPQNLTKEIGAALKDRAAAEGLAQRVAGNADAQAGLRRLVADHLLFQFKDASNVLSKAALTNFLTRNKPQMAAIFGEEGARRFQRLVDDIERSRKAQVTGKDPAGPGTAGDLAALAKGSVFGMAISALSGKSALIGGAIKVVRDAMKTAGMNEIDKVLAKALLEPNFARQLLTKAPALKNEKFLRGFVRSIARPALLGAVRGGAQFEGAR